MSELTVACRLVLVFWLGIAGVLKLRHPAGFRRAVHHYRILPRRLGRVYAALCPVVELAAVISLASGFVVGAGAFLAGLLLASFTIAVGINLRRHRDLDCHCFGDAVHIPLGLHTLVVDVLLLIAAAWIWQGTAREGLLAMTWPLRGTPPSTLAFALGVIGSLTLGLFYVPGFLHWRPARSETGSTLATSVQEK
jgi:hypothetical protein